MPDREDAPMRAVQPAGGNSAAHAAATQPESRELEQGHDPVLPSGERGQRHIEGGSGNLRPS